MRIRSEEIPPELRGRNRWLVWREERRAGKIAKSPIGSTIDNPTTWLSFDDAQQKAAAVRADGLGFVLGDGVVGIDFDDAIDPLDGSIHPAAQKAVTALNSYAELSPSGTGLHILVYGTIARSRKCKATTDLPAREIYDGRRYFTMTGSRISEASGLASGPATQAALDVVFEELFAEAPANISSIPAVTSLTDGAILEHLRSAKNRTKAMALYAGDWADSHGSQSEADFVLVRILRFYTRDTEQIDRIFRRSGLFRPKWDERHGEQTYGALTIARAISAGGHCYRQGHLANPEPQERPPSTWAKFPLWWLGALRDTKGAATLRVLIALASYCDANGKAWPTQETIAAVAGVSLRAVKEAGPILEAAGILMRMRRPGEAYEYVLHFARQVQTRAPSCPQEITASRDLVPPPDLSKEVQNLVQEPAHVERESCSITDQEQTSIDTGGQGSAKKLLTKDLPTTSPSEKLSA